MQKIKLLLAIAAIVFVSCKNNSGFITNQTYKQKVMSKFEQRRAMCKNRDKELFDVLNSNISDKEKEALKFLYAYMPLCDLADYNGNFFLKQVKASFEAKETFRWGKSIPEDIFRHFVLPYRVNNENLDTARIVFLKELKNRIINMDMYHAALEVNHWCHEKVNYQPTDIRTSAPLSTIRTSYGRCGEESTFTVTALRSVGIPARQVYTPRWAHCDDNHAWVEVWVDGRWYYMGACEPEPELNMAWFTEPARRAMIVHTKVFGDYNTDSEIVKKEENYTEINTIENYAEIKNTVVKVVDNNGTAVNNATVDFGIYNYAEFYPAVSKKTDNRGIASLTSGIGDMQVWAHNNTLFANTIVKANNIDTVTLVLNPDKEINLVSYITINPPAEKIPYKIGNNNIAEHKKRLKSEDNIRKEYRYTFIKKEDVDKIADELEIDSQELNTLVKNSMGNWQTIINFLKGTDYRNRGYAINLLKSIAKKDLRDISLNVLNSHLFETLTECSENEYSSKDIFTNYILNPRIKNEMLVSYRHLLKQNFVNEQKINRDETVHAVVNKINNDIEINESDNYYRLPITPVGVNSLKISNRESRDIYFVAICRSLGVPARLNPTDKEPQYYNGQQWLNVMFEKQNSTQPETGTMVLKTDNNTFKAEPKYRTHFSIARLSDNVYNTLDFGWDTPLSSMPDNIELPTGKYRLLTSNRRNDGAIFTKTEVFSIDKDKVSEVSFIIPEYEHINRSYGTIDNNMVFSLNSANVNLNKMVDMNKTTALCWIDPGTEPTKHTLIEISDMKDEFEKWNGNIVFILPDNMTIKDINKDITSKLPGNSIFVNDNKYNNYKNIAKAINSDNIINTPFVAVITEKNNISTVTSGYRIGIGDILIKSLNNLY
ncbi:MAG: transglutaminase-like domain-containing protein [Bacteroidales bacterium]|jgi:hypothetical protein|nr:transglutaminase-like domain-containing protein [Bacteroidales bacterium]